MFCVKCGTNTGGTGVCPQCGTPEAPQQNTVVQRGFIGEVYSRSFQYLFKKPILLWGLSLMYSLLTVLAVTVGFMTPFLWIPVVLVLQLGMASIYLNGLRGNAVNSKQLFDGFNKKFFRNAGGMGWMTLWTVIWTLPIFLGILIIAVGAATGAISGSSATIAITVILGVLIILASLVFAVIKSYAYRFVPYIMLNEPDIHATDALKKSMRLTKGYKGKMFGADIIISAGLTVASIVFYFIGMIPVLGVILNIIYYLLVVAVLPLIMGILAAAYYDKVVTDNPNRN
jgi:uncharacterized membrane protein